VISLLCANIPFRHWQQKQQRKNNSEHNNSNKYDDDDDDDSDSDDNQSQTKHEQLRSLRMWVIGWSQNTWA